jgi:hypothetical protein
MAKYELLEKTEVNGEVWYFIRKDEDYVNNSYSKNLAEVEEMLEQLKSGKPSKPIIKILKTIEVDENKTD